MKRGKKMKAIHQFFSIFSCCMAVNLSLEL
jgi:hypothetical protein